MMAVRPACFLTFHTVAIYSAKERYDTWLKSQEEFNDSFVLQVLLNIELHAHTPIHIHLKWISFIHTDIVQKTVRGLYPAFLNTETHSM